MDPDEKQAKPPSFSRLLAMNKPEWREGILGTIGAVGFGVVQPMYAFVLGSMISTLYLKDFDKMRREVTIYAAVFGGLAVACFIVNFLQHYYFAAMGELLTKRIRLRMLSKVLTFEVGWFDRDENSSGAICGRLASEANVVSHASPPHHPASAQFTIAHSCLVVEFRPTAPACDCYLRKLRMRIRSIDVSDLCSRNVHVLELVMSRLIL